MSSLSFKDDQLKNRFFYPSSRFMAGGEINDSPAAIVYDLRRLIPPFSNGRDFAVIILPHNNRLPTDSFKIQRQFCSVICLEK